jgi:NADPH:quinone reductase-like Zn-dependent oxidoreductase
VYGASGAVGTSAVQLAKHFGAHVTGVCGTSNLDLVRSLGSDATIDYTTEDSLDGGASYDLVLDAVGKRKSSPLKVAAKEAIALGGAYVSVDDGTPKLPASDLDILKDLVESGDLRPVVDCTYPLEQIAEAHRYVEEEHKRGNVVITIPHHTV